MLHAISSTLVKFQCEFGIKSSRGVLFSMVSTPSGLSEWFCEDVSLRNGQYCFSWGDDEAIASLVGMKRDEWIRFQWIEGMPTSEDAFFEFRIRTDAMTGDHSLQVTDFSEPEDVEEARELWEAQVEKLRHILGA
jgi:hypothetical protein